MSKKRKLPPDHRGAGEWIIIAIIIIGIIVTLVVFATKVAPLMKCGTS
jgi:hypothetical protein